MVTTVNTKHIGLIWSFEDELKEVYTLESYCETSGLAYQKQRRAERKVSNEEMNTNQQSTVAKLLAIAVSIWPVPSILTRKAPISAEKQGHAPPGEFFALGSKSKPSTEAEFKQVVTSNQPRKVVPPHGVTPVLPVKREAPSAPAAATLVAKKPRLASQTFTPLGRSSEIERRGSPTTQVYLYEEIAAEVEGCDLLNAVDDAYEKTDDDRLEALLCGAVKHLKANRAKPDPAMCLALMVLAKTQPNLFNSEVVIEAFCSLLKRDVTITFKAKGNAAVSVLTCNVLMTAFQDDENWPDSFVKVFMDDSLGERLWVDRCDCKAFVENIQTAFGTKLPHISMVASETAAKAESAGGGSPIHCPSALADEEDSLSYAEKYSKGIRVPDEEIASLISPRYNYQQSSIESYVLDVIREQLSRRQPMDGGGSRNLVRTMTSVSGYAEVRSLAAQRLEMWLQNPKLTRPAQDLLMTVCLNCSQRNVQQDVEVTNMLSKIRLKTKSLVSHYLMSMKELLGQNVDNIRRLLLQTITNEMSATRSPNNMMLITVMFQQSPEQTSKLLAEIFLDFLMGRDDVIRPLRTLLREIIRAVKLDMNFGAFTMALMRENVDIKFRELDVMLKERYCMSVVDLICLAMLLSITTSVRESASAMARSDVRDLEVLRNFQKAMASIQRDAVWWLLNVVPKLVTLKSCDFMLCLRKVLFVEKGDHYYKIDNWPPENERNVLLRLVSEVPVLEDTVYRVLTMGLSRDLHLSTADLIELVDIIIRRAAAIHTDDYPTLKVDRIELMDVLLNLCSYRHPENIVLPKGYKPPVLAITSLYWKAWTILLVLSAFNPTSFGKRGWYEYPTLRCLMEMTMTNCYKFPPPTTAPDEASGEEFRSREVQVSEFVKQQILEFESHLAAATSKNQITETNSLLISQLTRMEPADMALRPPNTVLDHLRNINQTLRVGHMLCRCRSPDFLLEIIQQQGTSQSLPWLAELVESNDSSLDVLPVQCLCEFLIHDSMPGTTSNIAVDEDGIPLDKTKKQKHKQEQLLMRLQSLMQSTNMESQVAVSEVLDYFLKRLSSLQSSTRKQAVKGLSMVLSKTMLEDLDSSPMVVDANSAALLLPSHLWLLDQLPSLPLFELVKINVCTALRHACQLETDASAVSAYIIFLSQHTLNFDIHDLDGLVLDMAQLIVERATLINHLLPQDGIINECAQRVLIAMIKLFYVYLTKAQQPQNEAIQWSESQDQIRLQWQSGKSAIMNILVVHAMIILLTYGKPEDASEFESLLSAWFPQNGSPPSAFLVDTSEEALLLPDWLKLRMIRSSVSRLVDAALFDLDPGQLLLFVQSFGIPVESMSRLLHCLDRAFHMDPGAMESALVDKSYMAQLIEVQRLRGVTGGIRFYQLLLDGHSAPEQLQYSSLLETVPRLQTHSLLHRTPDITLSQTNSMEALSALLVQVFASTPYDNRNKDFQTLLKGCRNSNVANCVVQSLVNLLLSPVSSTAIARGLQCHVHLACSLIRVLALSKQSTFSQLMDLLAVAVSIYPPSVLSSIIAKYKKPSLEVQVSSELSKISKACSGERHQILKTVVTSSSMKEQDLSGDRELLIKRCLEKITTIDESTLSVVHGAIITDNDSISSKCSGALLDWLELSSPDIIDGCLPPMEMQLEFLFGIRHHQQEGNKSECSRSYLLSFLVHQCRWSTVNFIIHRLLSSQDNVDRYDPSTVLDFLKACIQSPKIWQGRDRKLPKNHVAEDVLGLSSRQAVTVICYMLAEARANNSPDSVNQLLGHRLDFLQACCCKKRHLVNAVINFLSSSVRDGCDGNDLCRLLLLHMYIWFPQAVITASKTAVKTIHSTESTQASQLDAVTHRLIRSLGSAAPSKAVEGRMLGANTVCRKLASEHPALILRQLPMLSALLQGRTHFSFGELRQRNYFVLYTHVIGIIELLQPHIFQPQYSASLQNILDAFFDLLQIHARGGNKQLMSLMLKFMQLVHNFLNYNRTRCFNMLNKYVPFLNCLSQHFPDMPVLGSLLAGLSLPVHKVGSEVTSSEASDAVIKFKSPWTSAQLVPIIQGTQKGANIADTSARLHELDEMSKRHVDVLENFTSTLQRLMTHSNETCRSDAHKLMMRLIRHEPRFAKEFYETMVKCIESSNSNIMVSALQNLAEYSVLTQENALELLMKVFVVSIMTQIETTVYLSETFQMLNLETMI